MSEEPCVAISPGVGDHDFDLSHTDRATGKVTWFGAPPAVGEMLAPCPFCGCDYPDTPEGDNGAGDAGLEVCNTHTPSFWIRCNACGAEQHGDEHPYPTPDEAETPEAFVRARAAAVAAWNNRDQRWRTRS